MRTNTVSKKNHDKVSFLPFFILLPFCLPELVYFSDAVSLVVRSWKVLVVIYAVFIGFKYRMQVRGSVRWILAMYIVIAIVSCINRSIPYLVAYEMSIIVLFNHFQRKSDISFLKAFVAIAEILIVANFISVLLYPDGLYSTTDLTDAVGYEKNWLMGYKNPMVRFMLPACVCSHLLSGYDLGYKKIRAWMLTAISLLTTVLVDSSTGAGGMVVFVLVMFVYNYGFWKWMRKLCTVVNVLVAILVIDILFVVMFNTEYFSWIIENVFGRQSDLTGRMSIWAVATELVIQKPLLGYGSNVGNVLADFTYAHHPHNFMLYTLLQGGIVALLLFVFSVVKAQKEIDRIVSQKMKGIIVGGFCAMLVMGITESLTAAPFLFIIFPLCKLNSLRNENRIGHNVPY